MPTSHTLPLAAHCLQVASSHHELAYETITALRRGLNVNSAFTPELRRKKWGHAILGCISTIACVFLCVALVFGIVSGDEEDDEEDASSKVYAITFGLVIFGSFGFICASRVYYWLYQAWYEGMPNEVHSLLRNLMDRRALTTYGTNVMSLSAAYPDDLWDAYKTSWATLANRCPDAQRVQDVHDKWIRAFSFSTSLAFKLGPTYDKYRINQQVQLQQAMRRLRGDVSGDVLGLAGIQGGPENFREEMKEMRKEVKELRESLSRLQQEHGHATTHGSTKPDHGNGMACCSGVHPLVTTRLKQLAPMYLILGVAPGIALFFVELWIGLVWLGCWVLPIAYGAWLFPKLNTMFNAVENGLLLERELRQVLDDETFQALNQHSTVKATMDLYNFVTNLRQTLMENNEAVIAIHFASEVLMHGDGRNYWMFRNQNLKQSSTPPAPPAPPPAPAPPAPASSTATRCPNHWSPGTSNADSDPWMVP